MHIEPDRPNTPSSEPQEISCLPADLRNLLSHLRSHVAAVPDGLRAWSSVAELLARDPAARGVPFAEITPFVDFSRYVNDPRFSGMTIGKIMEETRAERAREWEVESAERRHVLLHVLERALCQPPERATEILKTSEQHVHRAWSELRCDEGIRSLSTSLSKTVEFSPTRSPEEVREAFLHEVPSFACVPARLLSRAIDVFARSQTIARDLAFLDEHALRARIPVVVSEMKGPDAGSESQARFCALAAEVWARTYGYRPNETQLVAILLLSLQDENANAEGRFGYYQEIGTGEGKSLIAAMHAAFSVACGKQVVVATFNEELAQRDAAQAQRFFDHFRFSSGSFAIANAKSSRDLGCDILFSTSQDLIFQLLDDKLEARPGLGGRRFDLLIVDEADALLFDLRRETCRISAPLSQQFPEELWKDWIRYVDAIIDDETRGASAILKNPRGAFAVFRDQYQGRYHLLADFDSVEGAAFMRSAIISRQFEYKRDFVVRNKKVRTAEGAVDEQAHVTIVDFKHTGRIKHLSHWSHGLHQFVAARHNLPVWGVSGTLGQMAHADFARLFQRAACISGSWGEASDRESLRQRLQVDGFSVPRHRAPRRSDQLVPLLFPTTEEQTQGIRDVIASTKRATPNRPILIVCESIQESEALHKKLSLTYPCQLLDDENNLDNRGESKSESQLLDHAGQPGQITVTHKMSGRGSDIRLPPLAREAGGLLVVQAYLPVDHRDLVQVWGRAARQGDPGGGCILAALDTDTFFRTLPQIAQQLIKTEAARPAEAQTTLPELLAACRTAQGVCDRERAVLYEEGDRLLQVIQDAFFALQAARKDSAPPAVRELLEMRTDLGIDIGVSMRLEKLETWWVNRFRIFDCRVRNSEYVPAIDVASEINIAALESELQSKIESSMASTRGQNENDETGHRRTSQTRLLTQAFRQKLATIASQRAHFESCGFEDELATFKADLADAAVRFPYRYAIRE